MWGFWDKFGRSAGSQSFPAELSEYIISAINCPAVNFSNVTHLFSQPIRAQTTNCKGGEVSHQVEAKGEAFRDNGIRFCVIHGKRLRSFSHYPHYHDANFRQYPVAIQ